MSTSTTTTTTGNYYMDQAIAAGFEVYQRKPGRDTYFYFTDGAGIGYCQFGGSQPSLTTVHKPNTQTGTGFEYVSGFDEVNARAMRGCLSCNAPGWVSTGDRRSVRKYANWSAFKSADPFNAQLVQVQSGERVA